jgi:hypothetical protein
MVLCVVVGHGVTLKHMVAMQIIYHIQDLRDYIYVGAAAISQGDEY